MGWNKRNNRNNMHGATIKMNSIHWAFMRHLSSSPIKRKEYIYIYIYIYICKYIYMYIYISVTIKVVYLSPDSFELAVEIMRAEGT